MNKEQKQEDKMNKWIEDMTQEDFLSSIDISSTHIPFDPNIGHDYIDNSAERFERVV